MLRRLRRDEVPLIWGIDRSEVHHHIYRVQEGELHLVPAYFEIPGWEPTAVLADTPKLYECYDRGGAFIGEFGADALVGLAVVHPKECGARRDQAQLLKLYVSRSVRGQGIGSRLFEAAAEAGRAFGAAGLYISATPTENTVRFYLARGSVLVPDPDHDLLAAQPEDIHLTYHL